MEKRFGKPRFNDNKRDGGFRGRGFGNRMNRNFPKPINEGEEYDVEINEVGAKGDGITRIKNLVVFVPNTKQGEKCKIKIKTVRPKFAFAEKVGEGEKGSTEKGNLEEVETEEDFEESLDLGDEDLE